MVRVRVERPLDDVWSVFTTPGTWVTWWGAVLEGVLPGWEAGAILDWDRGPASRIVDFRTKERVGVEGAHGERITWTFEPDGPSVTWVGMGADLGSSSLIASSDAALAAEHLGVLERLRSCVEGLAVTVRATADSYERALGDARRKVPPNATIVETRLVPPATRTETLVMSQETGGKVDSTVDVQDLLEFDEIDPLFEGWKIRQIDVISERRRGFLGIGAVPARYKVLLEERAVTVEITYRPVGL